MKLDYKSMPKTEFVFFEWMYLTTLKAIDQYVAHGCCFVNDPKRKTRLDLPAFPFTRRA